MKEHIINEIILKKVVDFDFGLWFFIIKLLNLKHIQTKAVTQQLVSAI